MHKAFSLPANSGYRVGMKETDGKLHVSKTSVRRLIPRRNCTAVSSQVRVWQEELAELRNSTTGNSPPSTLCWSKGRALRVQILGHFFLLGITLLLHHGFEREMFCPRTQPTPFSARSQLKSSGTSQSQTWNLLGEESWPSWQEYSSSSPPCLAITGEHKQHSFLFSSVKQRCDVANYIKVYLHKPLGYP